MTTATETLTPGTLVRAPHYREGKVLGYRRGLILGIFANSDDPTSGYIIWFYNQGPAAQDGTRSIAFPREVTRLGDLEGMSERTLVKVAKGLRDFMGGQAVFYRACRLGSRLRNARRAAAHA